MLAQILGVALLGSLGAAPEVGSCDPEVIEDRATALAPTLGEIHASRQGGIVSLEIEAPSGAVGIVALQLEGGGLATSSNAAHLPPTMAEALAQLGPDLAADAVVMAELAGCDQDELTPRDVLLAKEREERAAVAARVNPGDLPSWASPLPAWAREVPPWTLLLMLLLGTLIAGRIARVRPAHRPTSPAETLPTLDWAAILPLLLGAALVSSLYLMVSADGLPIRHDSIRDLAVAQDLWDGTGPETRGSSITGVQHGRLWPIVLGFLRSTGASLGWIHALRDASTVAATALCVLLAVRLHGPRSAWAAAVAAGLLGPWLAVHPLLWNPALATLPLAALFVVLSLQLERGGTRLTVLAGVVAGIAMQAHPINAFAMPLVAAVATVRGDSSVNPLLAVATTLATVWIIDPGWILAWRSLETASVIGVAITGIVPLAIVLGWLARSRFARLSAASKQHVLIYATGTGLALVIAAASFFVGLPRRHYLAAIVPGVACFAGLMGARALARWAGPGIHVTAWIVACALAIAPGPSRFANRGYYLEDVEELAIYMHAHGFAREEAAMALHSPTRFAHVVLIPLLYPEAPPGPADADADRPLLAFVPDRGFTDTPPGWERVRLATTDILIKRGPIPWADRREFETCGLRDGEPWCQSVIDAAAADPASPWTQRTLNMDVTPWPTEVDPTSVTQRITIHAPEAGTRYFILDRGWELSGCENLECNATDERAVIELTSPGKVDGQLVLHQLGSEYPSAYIGLAAELEHPEQWIADSLR